MMSATTHSNRHHRQQPGKPVGGVVVSYHPLQRPTVTRTRSLRRAIAQLHRSTLLRSDDDAWGVSEDRALQQALATYSRSPRDRTAADVNASTTPPLGVPHCDWDKVAACVGTRNAQQCRLRCIELADAADQRAAAAVAASSGVGGRVLSGPTSTTAPQQQRVQHHYAAPAPSARTASAMTPTATATCLLYTSPSPRDRG